MHVHADIFVFWLFICLVVCVHYLYLFILLSSYEDNELHDMKIVHMTDTKWLI